MQRHTIVQIPKPETVDAEAKAAIERLNPAIDRIVSAIVSLIGKARDNGERQVRICATTGAETLYCNDEQYPVKRWPELADRLAEIFADKGYNVTIKNIRRPVNPDLYSVEISWRQTMVRKMYFRERERDIYTQEKEVPDW